MKNVKKKENRRRREREGERIKGGQTETHGDTIVGLGWKGKELHKITWEAQK